jgi:DNA-binding transcriptional LysR family regulator
MFTDLKKLMVFIAIVEEGSVTGAAERLNTAQPWVSVQLKQLESILGTLLVERSKGKMVRLTPAGQKLLPLAKRMLLTCEEVSDEINALTKGQHEALVLGFDPITLYMPQRNHLITQFMELAPQTVLQISNAPPAELFEGLRSGRFELILTACPNTDPDVEQIPLYEYNLSVFVPKRNAHEFKAATFDDLTGARFITLPDSYHPPVFSWLRTMLRPWKFDLMECPENSFHALIRYAIEMGRATMLPDLSDQVYELRNDMEVKRLPGQPELPVRWALMRRAGYHSKLARNFWNMAGKSQMLEKVVKEPKPAAKRKTR